jgi:hypothetical protein
MSTDGEVEGEGDAGVHITFQSGQLTSSSTGHDCPPETGNFIGVPTTEPGTVGLTTDGIDC